MSIAASSKRAQILQNHFKAKQYIMPVINTVHVFKRFTQKAGLFCITYTVHLSRTTPQKTSELSINRTLYIYSKKSPQKSSRLSINPHRHLEGKKIRSEYLPLVGKF